VADYDKFCCGAVVAAVVVMVVVFTGQVVVESSSLGGGSWMAATWNFISHRRKTILHAEAFGIR